MTAPAIEGGERCVHQYATDDSAVSTNCVKCGADLGRMVQIDKFIAELQETRAKFGNTCVYIRRGGASWGAVALNRQADDAKHGVFDIQAQHDRDMQERLEQVGRLIKWKTEIFEENARISTLLADAKRERDAALAESVGFRRALEPFAKAWGTVTSLEVTKRLSLAQLADLCGCELSGADFQKAALVFSSPSPTSGVDSRAYDARPQSGELCAQLKEGES